MWRSLGMAASFECGLRYLYHDQRVISKRRITLTSEIPASSRARFLPTRVTASSGVNRPKRSNSGSMRPIEQPRSETQSSAFGSGSAGDDPGEQRQILVAADRARRRAGPAPPPVATRPVSSCSSRQAAARGFRPARRRPSGCPSAASGSHGRAAAARPSVTMTPQLIGLRRPFGRDTAHPLTPP